MNARAPLPLADRADARRRADPHPRRRPVSLRDRLALRLAAPMAPRVPQKPLDIGLFDEDARNQLSLF